MNTADVIDEIDQRDWQKLQMGQPVYSAMYRKKMDELFNLRSQVRGSTKNVSMPRYDEVNFKQAPAILDCLIEVEKFKLAQKFGRAHTPRKDWEYQPKVISGRTAKYWR